MGEIRSTLDIIMEKARGVEVTDEDKAAFTRHDVAGKIRGLLQKALDGLSDAEGLRSEMEAMGADRREIAVAALKRECLERLVLEGDNTLLLTILAHVAGLDTAPLEELLKIYETDLRTRRIRQEAALRDRLKAKGISGAAVLPNLKADPAWTRYLADAHDRFRRDAVHHPKS